MTDRPLLRLVHISDIHFGDSAPNADQDPPSYFAKWRRFEGLLGHSCKAIRRLHRFVKRSRDEAEDAGIRFHVLMTGDATLCGTQTQFSTSQGFVSGQLKPSLLGLEEDDYTQLSIPGNHDQWKGKSVPFGGPTNELERYFPGLPAGDYCIPLDEDRTLRIFRIDTDAEVGPWGG